MSERARGQRTRDRERPKETGNREKREEKRESERMNFCEHLKIKKFNGDMVKE